MLPFQKFVKSFLFFVEQCWVSLITWQSSVETSWLTVVWFCQQRKFQFPLCLTF